MSTKKITSELNTHFILLKFTFFFCFCRIQWLFNDSDYIYPSVYITESMPVSNRIPMVRGRVKEARRVARQSNKSTKPKVYVYHRYVFTDSLNYIGKRETFNILSEIKRMNADGVILWGSSYDLDSK